MFVYHFRMTSYKKVIFKKNSRIRGISGGWYQHPKMVCIIPYIILYTILYTLYSTHISYSYLNSNTLIHCLTKTDFHASKLYFKISDHILCSYMGCIIHQDSQSICRLRNLAVF